jgi:hypothetical protein
MGAFDPSMQPVGGLDLNAVTKNMKKFEGATPKQTQQATAKALGQAIGTKITTKDLAPKKMEQVAALAENTAPEVKQAELEAKPKKELSSNEKVYMALAAVLPTLIGSAFGGVEGAKAGAEATGGFFKEIGANELDKQKRAEEAANKMEIAKVGFAEKAQQNELQRAQSKENAAMLAGVRAGDKEVAALKDTRDYATNLRKEYIGSDVIKNEKIVKIAASQIASAVNDPSSAGDIRLITNYMKTIDPSTGVKEGEFANAANAGGVPDRIRAEFNRIRRGERLTPEQRADFAKQALLQAQSYLEPANKLRQGYIAQAQKYGIDPQEVIFDPESSMSVSGEMLGAPPAPLAPAAGAPLPVDPDVEAYAKRHGISTTAAAIQVERFKKAQGN